LEDKNLVQLKFNKDFIKEDKNVSNDLVTTVYVKNFLSEKYLNDTM